MTRLLVSVRDADEAERAWRGGAALIDIKEPRRGALGAADPSIWRSVAERMQGRAPVSVALGELQHGTADQVAELPRGSGIVFVKFGLAQTRTRPDWRQAWITTCTALPAGTLPVAVIYADWRQAETPHPVDILSLATQQRCGAVLIDTFVKDGRTLLDVTTAADLSDWCRTVRKASLPLVLAGSLTAATIPAVLRLDPDYVAVRGAVCETDRASSICEQRVRQLAGQLTKHSRDVA